MERELGANIAFFLVLPLPDFNGLGMVSSVAGKIVGGTSLSPSFKFFTPPKGGSFMDDERVERRIIASIVNLRE